MLVVPGPPPQSVLNQRWLWQLLIVLLFVTFMLCLAGVDVSGALLSALMLWLAIIITRDGMSELSRYALVFAILCFLNLVFEVLPLLTEFNGRIQSTTHAHEVPGPKGESNYVYTVATKRTPLFDWSQGFVYNVQSLEMFVAPLTYALGVYLSVTAHQEIQLAGGPALDNDMALNVGGGPLGGPALLPPGDDGGTQRRARDSVSQRVNHFQGRCYKLDGGDAFRTSAEQVSAACQEDCSESLKAKSAEGESK